MDDGDWMDRTGNRLKNGCQEREARGKRAGRGSQLAVKLVVVVRVAVVEIIAKRTQVAVAAHGEHILIVLVVLGVNIGQGQWLLLDVLRSHLGLRQQKKEKKD